eukprot:3321834-Rhodomonas_salina.1
MSVQLSVVAGPDVFGDEEPLGQASSYTFTGSADVAGVWSVEMASSVDSFAVAISLPAGVGMDDVTVTAILDLSSRADVSKVRVDFQVAGLASAQDAAQVRSNEIKNTREHKGCGLPACLRALLREMVVVAMRLHVGRFQTPKLDRRGQDFPALKRPFERDICFNLYRSSQRFALSDYRHASSDVAKIGIELDLGNDESDDGLV